MKRWLKWIVLLLVLAGAGIALWMWLSPPARNETPRTVAVGRGNIEETVLASGVIEASSLVSVGAEVSGRIKSLDVALGDPVQAGDVVAEIDSLNQENAVKAAEAALASVEAQQGMKQAALAQAKVALQRADKLTADKLISDADYQTAQLAVQTAQGELDATAAQIQQAELSVDSAKLNLDRTRIVAPSDGTVVAVSVEVGQSVNATNSSPTIVKIANLDRMVVKAEISEADVPKVKPGQKVYFTILGDPDTRIEAKLRAIEPAPDSIASDTSTSGSSAASAIYYNGLFDVDNPEHKLRISMTAQVTIVLRSVEGVLTVPASALTRRPDGGYAVAIWDSNAGTRTLRPVEIGLNNKVTAEVVSGLEEGDLVIDSSAAAASRTTGTGSGGSNRNVLGGGGPRLLVGPGPGG